MYINKSKGNDILQLRWMNLCRIFLIIIWFIRSINLVRDSVLILSCFSFFLIVMVENWIVIFYIKFNVNHQYNN